jgi:hypothetical protein
VRNKTPFLTGFSARLCGRAKASAQALVAGQCRRVAGNTIAASARMFAPVLEPAFMEGLAEGRSRTYGEVTTFWAWAGQILGGNSSCSSAVGQVQAWCAESGRPVPSSSTAAYCIARARLSPSFLEGVHQRLAGAMAARRRESDLWHGMALKVIDGSSATLDDTPANQKDYPQHSEQKPGCGFPVMGFVGVLDLSSGGAWLGAVPKIWKEQDCSVAGQLLGHFGEGDLALADRAFGSYEFIARLQGRGAHVLMRLHPARHRKLDWRRGKKCGPCQRLVEWTKPACKPSGSRLDDAEWEALPATLSLRYIRFNHENRAGKKARMVLVTTLTDTDAIDWPELAALYATRWEIELKLRDLKTTLGMERFAVRSPEMARKTLLMMMVAHNLARAMMQRAAIVADCPPNAISFKGGLDLLAAWQGRHRAGGRDGRLAAAVLDCGLLDVMATKRVAPRPFRREPRAVKRRPKNYARLGVVRGECHEISRRSNYRKPNLI